MFLCRQIFEVKKIVQDPIFHKTTSVSRTTILLKCPRNALQIFSRKQQMLLEVLCYFYRSVLHREIPNSKHYFQKNIPEHDTSFCRGLWASQAS